MNAHLRINGHSTPYHDIVLTTFEHHATLTITTEKAIPVGERATFELDNNLLFTGSTTNAATHSATTHAFAHNPSFALYTPLSRPDGLTTITVPELIKYVIRTTPITTTHITAPKLTLPHFSWPQRTRGTTILNTIIRLLHTENPTAHYRYFCDNTGAFCFGTPNDTGAQKPFLNTIPSTAVIQHIPKHRMLKTLALPMLNHQTITLDNTTCTVITTELVINPEDSYTRITYAN